MPTVLCPNCQGEVENDHSVAGLEVTCPHCDGRFRMPQLPATQMPRGVAVPRAEEAPINILVTQPTQPTHTSRTVHHKHDRLGGGGWFTRSFATTFGVIAALLVIPAITCGGCLMMAGVFSNQVSEELDKAEVRDQKSIGMAKKALDKYGVIELSTDTAVMPSILDEKTDKIVYGDARLSSGEIAEFQVGFKITRFDERIKWRVTFVTIGGEEKFRRDE